MNSFFCRVKIILIATVCICLNLSCSNKNSTDALLQRAESLLEQYPDSALSVIGSIPINNIGTQRQRAEFILLYERILEKNNIPFIGEDDMIEAVAYFDKHGTFSRKFLAHFYLGRMYHIASDQYKAMEQYVQSEGAYKEMAQQDKNGCNEAYKELLARMYMYKGDIFHGKMNFGGALKMYLKAAEYYEEYGNDTQLMHILGKVAQGYESLNKHDEALKAYSGALHFARKGGNNSNILQYSTAMAGIDFSLGTPSPIILKQLDSIYTVHSGGVPPKNNYILLSCLYLDSRNIKKAREFANLYISSSEKLGSVEEAGIATLMSSIAKAEGNYKEALAYKERYSEIMESIEEQERANSVQEIEQLYYNRQLQLENENIKKQNRYMLAIYSLLVIILLLGLVWVIVSWRKKLKEKNNQIEEYLAVANEAELSKNNLLGELDMHIEKEKRLKELLENRFAEIRELAGTYYEFGYSKKLQKKVEQLLSLQSFGRDMFEVIENVVNAKNNGAMEKIRANYPSIPEENFKLLNLIYAGFSPQEISVILNDTPQNIYVRKSRLKRKISALLEQEPEMNFK